MFTGIINHIGTVLKIDKKLGSFGPEASIWVKTALKKVTKGDSVCVEGICLTVSGMKKNKKGTDIRFQASQETLDKTSLGSFKAGMEINIEPSLKVGDKLGGHFVQGHVDAAGKITRVIPQGNSKLYWFSFPPELDPFLVPKGSAAVNGVSLTVVEIASGQFSVSMLPYTEAETSFRSRKAGDPINLETDILAKVAVKQMRSFSGKAGSMELYQKKIVTWEEISEEIL